MINFKSEIAKILGKEIEGLSLEDLYLLLEIPQDEGMGDYALPCFKLAKEFRKAPNVIAEEIKEKISKEGLFMKVEAVSGYVNMFIDRKYYTVNVLGDAIEEGLFEKGPDIGKNRRVLVEYSSPNIAKPFHIGHIRSTVIGHSIYKIYHYLGYDALRLNHLGDYGTQFGKMIVAYRNWGNKDDVINSPIETLLSYYVKFHEEAEKDPGLEEEARKAFNRLENGKEEEVALWQWFRDESLKEFNRVYDLLGISFDSLLGESFYSDKMDRVVKELREKGLLKESEGAMIVDLEPYKLPSALITKSDGSTLYITRDIAAAIYRKEAFDFHKNLYIVGNQQILHFQQWMKIIELMGYHWAKDCVHIPFGLVSLEDGDNLSTRKGKVVFLEDVLNKAVEKTREIILEKNVNTDNLLETAKIVGIGAVVFNELSNSRAKDYVFSWDKVLNFEGETGPYVQYTYARASSILRNAEPELLEKVMEQGVVEPSYLTTDSAFRLVRLIYKFDEVVVEASERYEPSVIARYVVDVAQAFNRYYHEEHILVENIEEQLSKLALVIVTRSVIKEALNLLGVTAPEKM
ncbi:MAG: arginine--tRNA ligase [Anaerovoracaceae bacterium]